MNLIHHTGMTFQILVRDNHIHFLKMYVTNDVFKFSFYTLKFVYRSLELLLYVLYVAPGEAAGNFITFSDVTQ